VGICAHPCSSAVKGFDFIVVPFQETCSDGALWTSRCGRTIISTADMLHQRSDIWATATAAWYIATETSSELKKSGYVQGTVLLVLRRRLLRLVFEAIRQSPGIYLFDEFDALGAHRSQSNDVGEIRRVLNSFLQLLEKDDSQSLIVAATNHPELLDRALFRRFDDVIEYSLPDAGLAEEILRRKLAIFQAADIDWQQILPETGGLSQAELVRASEEAAKRAVLGGSTRITSEGLIAALHERKAASR